MAGCSGRTPPASPEFSGGSPRRSGTFLPLCRAPQPHRARARRSMGRGSVPPLPRFSRPSISCWFAKSSGPSVPHRNPVPALLDLGCGTGVAGAAWASEMTPPRRVTGVDRNPWAVSEARWTCNAFGLEGSAKTLDLNTFRIPAGMAIMAAFILNELPEEAGSGGGVRCSRRLNAALPYS